MRHRSLCFAAAAAEGPAQRMRERTESLHSLFTPAAQAGCIGMYIYMQFKRLCVCSVWPLRACQTRQGWGDECGISWCHLSRLLDGLKIPLGILSGGSVFLFFLFFFFFIFPSLSCLIYLYSTAHCSRASRAVNLIKRNILDIYTIYEAWGWRGFMWNLNFYTPYCIRCFVIFSTGD